MPSSAWKKKKQGKRTGGGAGGGGREGGGGAVGAGGRRVGGGLFFFFQAEDGIRDRDVTGVQTCALPICCTRIGVRKFTGPVINVRDVSYGIRCMCMYIDRKSTRLNSSHITISYAVFCLKKKKKNCDDHNEPLYNMRLGLDFPCKARSTAYHPWVSGKRGLLLYGSTWVCNFPCEARNHRPRFALTQE